MLTLDQLDEIVRNNVPDSFGCAEDTDFDGDEMLYFFENGMMRVDVLTGDFAFIEYDFND